MFPSRSRELEVPVIAEVSEMLKNPVVVDNQVQARGTAIQDLQERNFVMDERKISQLFTGYFNNKMTLLLFLIQAKKVKPNPVLVGTVHSFLDDMFRHMFEGSLQKRYRRIFKWLKLFFEKLPDVSVYQRDKAKDYVRAIYDAFGLHLKSDI